MQWLLELAQQYRTILRKRPFFQKLAQTSVKDEIRPWIRQLYYQSKEFAAGALPLRYKLCEEPKFKNCFAKHVTEEDNHCELLVDWMRQNSFLGLEESPTSVPAALETLAVTSYCFRSILTDSYDHQILSLNLISEGVSLDFFTAVIPTLEALELPVTRYWKIHEEVDKYHLALGLDLVEPCEPNSPRGQEYSRVVWETASLYGQMLDAWSGSPSPVNHQLPAPSLMLVGKQMPLSI